jgi:hypothetical protein
MKKLDAVGVPMALPVGVPVPPLRLLLPAALMEAPAVIAAVEEALMELPLRVLVGVAGGVAVAVPVPLGVGGGVPVLLGVGVPAGETNPRRRELRETSTR